MTNASQNNAAPDTKRANSILEQSKPTLLALPKDSLLKPRVIPARANQLTTILQTSFSTHLPHLKSTFAPAVADTYAQLYKEIDSRALAFYAAALALENALTPAELQSLRALAVIVAEHDDNLTSWFFPAFRDQPEIFSILENEIAPGRGRRDSAEDVLRFCQIGHQHAQTLTKRTPITLDELQQAEADATKLLQILAQEGQPSVEPARDLWRRSYTHWADAYFELCEAGRFLSRRDPKRTTLFPPIHPETNRTNKQEPIPNAPPSPIPNAPPSPTPA